MDDKNIYTKKDNLMESPKIKSEIQQNSDKKINPENNFRNVVMNKIFRIPKHSEEIKSNFNNSNQSNKNAKSQNNLGIISTFDKVVILQKLLKDFSSIKRRFNENMNTLTQKINNKSYQYFKNKVFIKEILEYCDSENPEEDMDYHLVEDNEKYFDKNIYQIISEFYFLIRNDNKFMLQIIKYSQENTFKELSDFFVNFLYENPINTSFIQDELILMIYLLLDALFFENFPKIININKINNNTLYNSLIKKNSFLYCVFQSLTKKIDVKNFIASILSNVILKMESFRNPLSPDLKIANKFLDKRDKNIFHSFIKLSSGEKPIINNKKRKKNLPNINQGFDTKENNFLKRVNNISLGSSNINDNNNENNGGKMVSIYDILNSDININALNIKYTNNDNKTNNKINTNIIKKELKKDTDVNKNLNNIEKQIETIPEEKIDIDPFFENNSITFEYLTNKLNEFKKETNNIPINIAMVDYLSYLINIIESGIKIKNNIDNNDDYEDNTELINIRKDKEIFSNSLMIEEFLSIRKIKNNQSFKKLMHKIKMNYKIITRIITRIINNINDNLKSSPFIIKYISKLLITLLDKKFKNVSGNKLTNLNIYVFKLNFFIGNIILPIIKNPDINGIITTEIISQITKDNLELIHDIFNKLISLELFNKYKEPYMTIFNPFIIEIMPKLFEILENIDNNFIIPFWIQKLINEKNNAIDNSININYDYFKQNENENIQYQTICFSWKNFCMIFQSILNNQNEFMKIIKNDEQKKLIKKLFQYKEQFFNFYSKNKKMKKEEFILLTKINFRKEFDNRIKSIIKDNLNLNIDIKIPSNDLIFHFKKSFSDILSFTKTIEKNDFISYTLNKNQTIYGLNLIRKINKIKYIKNNNSKDILIEDNEKELNFKNYIFPKILDNIKFEIRNNLNSNITNNIIFEANYLNMNINSIPEKYSINNFDLFFNELIFETEFCIRFINKDALLLYYTKNKEIEKNLLIISEYSSQIRNLEKLKCIEFLLNNIKIPYELNIENDSKGLIKNIKIINQNNNTNNKNEEDDILRHFKKENKPINFFIQDFPDFNEYEYDNNNILDLEEKTNSKEVIYNYFSKMENIIKKEKIIKRFNKKELNEIIYDMQNYLFTLLYDKLFPSEPTNDDNYFYNKCSRLNFIKPENVIFKRY